MTSSLKIKTAKQAKFKPDHLKSVLCVEKLTKRFGGVFAVHDCTLDIKEGRITSIIGPNGAGKTTLFNLICGITRPEKGHVVFNQVDITKKHTHEIAGLGLTRTFQQARLFKNLSVKDNLLISRPASGKELREVLSLVNFPLSMETKAGELSYGQTRLVEIARALLRPHSLLMLDEPTAGVNPHVRGQLKSILLNLRRQGKTIVLIEHDMEFVMSISDEVIVMVEGAVLTRGKPSDIQNDKRVLEAYLGK